MDFYITSICLLACACIALGIWAIIFTFSHLKKWMNQWANILGMCLAAAACLSGFAGAMAGPWQFSAPPQIFNIPWGLPIGNFALRLDPLARLFLLPVFGLGLVCALCGKLALSHERASEHNLAAHWFFYLLLLLGMALVICAHDSILFLLSWEVMSLAPFFLIDFNDRDAKVRDASWIYLAAAHLGAVFLIAFFALLWQASGQTAFDAATINTAFASSRPWLSPVLFLLALAGFGAKAGIAPLHVWLPEAHPAAPSHISAILSGAMINVGLYGLLRAISILSGPSGSVAGVLGQTPAWQGWLILVIGLCTALLGIIKALGQGNLKRLLAYSSVENMGLMFIGAGAGIIGSSCGDAWIAALGFGGALLHMLNHAGFKGLLFLCAGEVLHSAGTVHMELLGGMQKKLPFVGCLFALGAASIACLPPLSGFAGEFTLFMALANGASAPGVERQLGLLLALAILALVSGLACALYVKAYGMIFLGNPRTGFASNAENHGMRAAWPLLLPALACIAGGILAPLFFNLAGNAGICAAPLAKGLVPGCIEALHKASDSLVPVSVTGAAVITLAVILYALRKFMLAARDVRTAPTWGCGYQAISARIQYTDASFSEPLARIFGPIMGLKAHGGKVDGIFPKQASLGFSAPDRIKELVFTPLFETIERLCNACKIIQHGKIHLYILYILTTLVCLLVWGLRP